MAIIAMTTSNSISVNALHGFFFLSMTMPLSQLKEKTDGSKSSPKVGTVLRESATYSAQWNETCEEKSFAAAALILKWVTRIIHNNTRTSNRYYGSLPKSNPLCQAKTKKNLNILRQAGPALGRTPARPLTRTRLDSQRLCKRCIMGVV